MAGAPHEYGCSITRNQRGTAKIYGPGEKTTTGSNGVVGKKSSRRSPPPPRTPTRTHPPTPPLAPARHRGLLLPPSLALAPWAQPLRPVQVSRVQPFSEFGVQVREKPLGTEQIKQREGYFPPKGSRKAWSGVT